MGPYPCISALQALERTCDQLVKQGVPIGNLVSVLLDGCENLAMVGLAVGMLVRHLEVADKLLDPYITEPLIWSYEFRRVVSEHSGWAASSEGVKEPERRNWPLSSVTMFMALRATDERAEDLQALGETLVVRARTRIDLEYDAGAIEEEANRGEDIKLQLAKVRAWASSFDRSTFQFREAPEGTYIQAKPSEDVVETLQPGNEDRERASEAIRLASRYFIKPNEAYPKAIEPDDLTADIVSASKLPEDQQSLIHPWDVRASVAAAALHGCLLRRVELPNDALAFAVDTVLQVSEGVASPRPHEFAETYLEEGADRSAARGPPTATHAGCRTFARHDRWSGRNAYYQARLYCRPQHCACRSQ